MYQSTTISQAELRDRTLLQQVYAWMAGGLGVTGLVALWAYDSGFLETVLLQNSGIMFGLIFAELAVVIGLSWTIRRMSVGIATAAFLAYAVLNGLTLSVIFLAYTAGSIASTFFVTAATFGAMSIYGYTTKRDLTKMGSLLIMALIGFLLASVVNIFLHSTVLYWIVTYIGVAIFIGLTAYDTQKLKRLSATIDGRDTSTFRKMVILGALTLYLDFVNLFLLLLRIMGRRR
ncbi:MAG: Bax inhibitor-1/YccA family protein [Herpetosiphonaceae bacterium]|nr:Bax inhibitor-1/YccA family protein [Herpetosiphonaceae bacterium]